MKITSPARFFPFLLTAAFGIFIGYFLALYLRPLSSPTAIRRSQNYRFINPLLDYDFPVDHTTNRHLNQIKNQVENRISQAQKKGQIQSASVYYRELNDGPWFGINESQLFSPSSLIKVPLMIAVYQKAQSDPSLLDRRLTNSADPDLSQNIKPENTLEKGRTYSVSDLLHQMIVFSDNTAYNLLLSQIEPSLLSQIYQDLGVQLHTADNPTNNIIAVKDYASIFRILYNASYLNRDYSEKALFLLSQTKFRQALAAGLPQDLTVSHKFGERYFEDLKLNQLHDCGIIYQPQKPYLLCLMTQGRDFNQLAAFIADISSLTYQLQVPSK